MAPDSRGKVVAIIQARMGSTRLPGKSLMPLAGRALVYRVLERIKRAETLDQIILAIPDSVENHALAEIAEELGVDCFLGSEEDVLDRYYQAGLSAGAQYIVRIPADNPTSEPAEIDKVVRHHLGLGRAGFSTNLAEIRNSGYPDGIGAEIFDFSLLQESWSKNFDGRQREHVHLNFYDYTTDIAVDENWCPISTLMCPPEYARPDLVLDINIPDQYRYFERMYGDLYPKNPNFGIIDIIKWHDSGRGSNQGSLL